MNTDQVQLTISGNLITPFPPTIVSVGNFVIVQSVSGINPTLDVILQESPSGGISWKDVYHVARFTDVGQFQIPNSRVAGLRRWSWIVGGTDPVFNVLLISTNPIAVPTICRQFFDRSIDITTVGSTTATFDVDMCTTLEMIVNVSLLAGNAPSFQLMGSLDGVYFFPIGAVVTSTAVVGGGMTATAQIYNHFLAKQIYAQVVSKTAKGNLLDYICFAGRSES